MPEAPFLTIHLDHGVTIAEFGPRAKLIEEPILDALTSELLAVATAANPPLLLLDMAQTTFFGSAFLETLFRVWKNLQSRPNAKMGLCNVYTYCREVLEITHLDKIWPIYATREEALAAMQSAP